MQEVAAGRFREDLFYRLHVLPIHLLLLRDREGDAVEIAARMLREAAAEAGNGFCNLSHEVHMLIASYDWPGNVRELQFVIHQAVADHEGELLTSDMLPGKISGESAEETTDGEGAREEDVAAANSEADVADSEAASEDNADVADGAPSGTTASTGVGDDETLRIAVGETLAEMERRFIEATIESCDGSLPRAARMLEVNPSTLYRKRESWSEEA
ncbi:helix-turn-helix domain-containing protein [Breoghania sp.]|uniref:helix-turn-helix domain-containing protein n=1 Tax=Breoghania sp. TaxID=2065378 RepID=UPI002614FA86|nr:helix-turn-helix domain-containing protein [Breoghania sp.]MDJ0932240.1 helix-turn-helix domain-containing protein [Breoghania sp.]